MVQTLSPLVLQKIESMDVDENLKDVIKELLMCEARNGNTYPEGKLREFNVIISKGMSDED